jgi:hypothetical protein
LLKRSLLASNFLKGEGIMNKNGVASYLSIGGIILISASIFLMLRVKFHGLDERMYHGYIFTALIGILLLAPEIILYMFKSFEGDVNDFNEEVKTEKNAKKEIMPNKHKGSKYVYDIELTDYLFEEAKEKFNDVIRERYVSRLSKFVEDDKSFYNVNVYENLLMQEKAKIISEEDSKFYATKVSYFIKERFELDLMRFKIQIFDLVNYERQRNGLNRLIYSDILDKVAQQRARELTQMYGHIRPDGRSFDTALSDLGEDEYSIGENAGIDNNDALKIMKGWMESPLHRENILYFRHNQIGVGVHNENEMYYWIQIFS